MVLLYYNRTSVGRSAFVHHRLTFVMGTISMSSGAMVDGTAFMTHGVAIAHARALMDGSPFMLRCVLVD